jgi:tRNA pseudouridine55 synthase
VVARVRRALGTRRVGHTGTLDPFASGLLALVVGAATRLSPFLTGLAKEYHAEARLGISTDTLDREGAVVGESSEWERLDRAAIEKALAGLRGEQLQTPPAFSAKKVGGEASHRRARRGEDVRLEPVLVRVHELRLEELDLPRVRLFVRCSSGTYVRALARDLGELLGVGAHLAALRRTAVGPFSIEDAVGLAELEAGARPASALLRPGAALAAAGMPCVRVGPTEVARLVRGQAVDAPDDLPAAATRVALVDAAGLVAVADGDAGRLRPRKVFRTEPAAG